MRCEECGQELIRIQRGKRGPKKEVYLYIHFCKFDPPIYPLTSEALTELDRLGLPGPSPQFRQLIGLKPENLGAH